MALDINGIGKAFGTFRAVEDISFRVEQGGIFGFLGTNGAGKTTTMRMVLDIIRADTGSITWNGTPTTSVPRDTFGYLPEERGLYPKMPVDDQLRFLAQLYGAERRTIDREIDEWLDRLAITENRHKMVDQLSKGNQQKIQFLAAILHDPDILILDEPFSGLDPVNANQMREAFMTMRDRGKTIIFSTHQLDDAQELCRDVAIIHRGKMLHSGTVDDVRASTDRKVVRLGVDGGTPGWIADEPDVRLIQERGDHAELSVPDDDRARALLRTAIDRGAEIRRFEISFPSLNDVFIESVGAANLASLDGDPAQTAGQATVATSR